MHLAAVEEMFSRHLDDRQAAALRGAFARILLGNGITCGEVTDDSALAAEGEPGAC